MNTLTEQPEGTPDLHTILQAAEGFLAATGEHGNEAAKAMAENIRRALAGGMAAASPEIDRMLVVSTAHVSAEERELLYSPGGLPSGIGHALPTMRGEYGWLIYVTDHDDSDPEDAKPSDGLAGVLAVAKRLGLKYVRFDSDADTLEGVPTYEW